MNKGTVDIPLDEVGAAEEEESGTMEPVAAAPEPDPAQIAASMQVPQFCLVSAVSPLNSTLKRRHNVANSFLALFGHIF